MRRAARHTYELKQKKGFEAVRSSVTRTETNSNRKGLGVSGATAASCFRRPVSGLISEGLTTGCRHGKLGRQRVVSEHVEEAPCIRSTVACLIFKPGCLSLSVYPPTQPRLRFTNKFTQLLRQSRLCLLPSQPDEAYNLNILPVYLATRSRTTMAIKW